MDFGQIAQSYLTAQNQAAVQPTTLADGALGSIGSGLEVVGAGVLCAYLNARSPAEGKSYHEMFGYPTDFAAGVGLGALGLVMMLSGSRSGGHLLRLGVGCLAEGGIRVAFEKGVSDRNKEKQLTGAQVRQIRAVPPQTSQAMQKTASDSPFQGVR